MNKANANKIDCAVQYFFVFKNKIELKKKQ